MPGFVVFKEIKPKRFDDKAFARAIEQAAKRTANEIEADYRETTKGWKTKVAFKKILNVSGRGAVEIFVGTDNKIYRYVDQGTEPHLILPKKKSILRWESNGRPVFSSHAFHPGFKGYKHTQRIAKVWQPKFRQRMEEAMREGAKKSGHAFGR